MIIDLFAGAGGWDCGARLAGLEDPIGIETMTDACRTRSAAGMLTIRADVATYPLEQLPRLDGLIASPPCQTFSTAGHGTGRDDYGAIVEHARSVAAGGWTPYEIDEWTDRRSPLVLEVLRWTIGCRPTWVACEQVPEVLPLWTIFADVLETLGFRTWTGILNAADYGVPQTRRRAFLLAHRDRIPMPPPATHDRDPHPVLFGDELAPWQSMAAALGWGAASMPYPPICARGNADRIGGMSASAQLDREYDAGRWAIGFGRRADAGASTEDGLRTRDFRTADQPAQCLTEKARSWQIRDSFGTPKDDYPGRQESRWKDADAVPSPAITGVSSGWQIRAGTQAHAARRTGDQPAPTVMPFDQGPGRWIVDTGTTTQLTSDYDADDRRNYERPIDQPAPTLDAKSGAAWKIRTSNPTGGQRDDGDWPRYERSIDEPAPTLDTLGHQWQIIGINTGRDWKPGGTRDDAQTIAPDTPAPTIDGAGRWHALVALGIWPEDRPATTLTTDAVLGAPIHHRNRDDPPDTPGRADMTIRLDVGDALVLQSFPRDYPLQGNKSSRFVQVGNAVPPRLAAQILTALTISP